MTLAAAAYPAELEADVALRDGSVAHIRPIQRCDETRLLAFLRSLPEDDRRMRFFSVGGDLSRTAHEEADVDYMHALGLLATVGPEQRVVGHALYAPCGPKRAEVAFAIDHEFQGRGLATILLGQLAEAAAAHGVETFEAVVLVENRRMLGVFRESGFPMMTHYAGDTVEVTFPTSLSHEALARFEQREELAAASALRRMLYSKSVAVIGGSDDGAAVVRNLLDCGFPGPIYPIQPKGHATQLLHAYRSVGAVPGPVDLAIIAAPTPKIIDIAEQCGRKGVRALMALTAGFGEAGIKGAARQAELLRVCRASGMRLLGPNCIGAINTDPTAPLNATFGPLMPRAGQIGLATQSGAVGLAAIDFAAARDLGFSSMVSMGDKADISGNDLLGYWHTDPRTDVILLYLESFGNPRKFGRFARSVGRHKPIVVIKSGRSAPGSNVTRSRTGALLSSSDSTVDTLFRQAGVIRTESLDEMLDVADLLAHQPLPAGQRVAIVSNVRGPAGICADACQAHGLELSTLSDATQAWLRKLLPTHASLVNPVDMLATATAEQYEQILRAVSDDPNVDAVIVICVPSLTAHPEQVGRAVAAANGAKPVAGVFMSAYPLPNLVTSSGGRVPGYRMPESAAIALAHAARYAAWRAAPVELPPVFSDLQRDEAALLLQGALRQGSGWLGAADVRKLLSLYGVPVVDQRVVDTADQAAIAALELGGAVAVKAISPGVAHKADFGGVRLGLIELGVVRAAADAVIQSVREAVGQQPTGLLVQRMAPAGVEMLVGVVQDKLFGPAIVCGPVGTPAELLRDVSVRLGPLTRADASHMLRELRSFPMLDGYRGAQPCAVGALEDVLLRIAALAEDHPQIAEIDCDPVIVGASGAVVVDAQMWIEDAAPRHPLGARR